MAKYIYSVQDDFPGGQVVSSTCLTGEINVSSITATLDYVYIEDDVVDIVFLTALTTGEEDTLDTIVDNHNNNCPADQEQEEEEEYIPGPIDVEKDDVNVSSDISVVNFEGNVTIVEDEPYKVTVTIPTVGQPTLEIQEDDINPISNVDTLNFEGNVNVTDDGSGKATVNITGGGGGVGDGDFEYNESNGQSSTSSTDWQQKVRLTFTPDTAGYYAITYSFMSSHSDTGVFYKNRLQVDDTNTYHEYAQEFYNFKYGDGAWQGRTGKVVVYLDATEHDIDLDYCTDSSGKPVYIKEALVLARRIS